MSQAYDTDSDDEEDEGEDEREEEAMMATRVSQVWRC